MEPLLENLVLTEGQWLNFTKGGQVFVAGEEPKGAYLVCSGRVELAIRERDRVLYRREILPGEVIGLSSAISGKPHRLTATVISDAVVGRLPCGVLQRMIATDIIFGLRCLELLTQELRAARGALNSLEAKAG
jgi:CRP-like cAMP-binding protein